VEQPVKIRYTWEISTESEKKAEEGLALRGLGTRLDAHHKTPGGKESLWEGDTLWKVGETTDRAIYIPARGRRRHREADRILGRKRNDVRPRRVLFHFAGGEGT